MSENNSNASKEANVSVREQPLSEVKIPSYMELSSLQAFYPDRMRAELQFPAVVAQIERLKVRYLSEHRDWVDNAKKNDPVLDQFSEGDLHTILMPYPGLIAMAAHGEAKKLYDEAVRLKRNNPDDPDALSKQVAARTLSETAKALSGIDIHPGANVAPDFFIDHGTGVVIGETAIIGKGSFSLHGVTLGGSELKSSDENVAGGVRRHPAIGDNVKFGSNVNIYGACTIGNNVTLHTGARLIDCEVGDNVIIGHGVDLRGVVIPPNTSIYNAGKPMVAVYAPDYQGKGVLFREKPDKDTLITPEAYRTPEEAADEGKRKDFKQSVTSEYYTPEEIQKHKSWLETLYQKAEKGIAAVRLH